MTTRAALRDAMRQRRQTLPIATRMAAATAVAAQLEQLPEFLVDQTVAGYWAVRGELPLHEVVGALRRREQTYLLPVLDGAALRFAPFVMGAALNTNRFGIPEPAVEAQRLLAPEAVELVLVPLLAFDRRGNRLGAGAGFYDRSFSFLRAGERPRPPVLVGVAYAFQETEALPAEDWDVRLDFIVTERELIDCDPRPK